MERVEEQDSNGDVENSFSPPEIATWGFLDSLRGGFINGWAVATVAGKSVPLLEVRVLHESGTILGQGLATLFRRDVQDSGLPTGWCGFSISNSEPLPVEGNITLQALVETSWTMVGQWRITEVPNDSVVNEIHADLGEYFSDMLSVFAGSRTTGGVIGKSTLKVGSDIWIQVSSKEIGLAKAKLRLGGEVDSTSESAFLRVEGGGSEDSRVDVRFRLRKSLPSNETHLLRVPVRITSNANGSVSLNIFANDSRTSLGTFRLPLSQWVTIEAALPDIKVPFFDPSNSQTALWIELVGSNLSVLDIGEPIIEEFESGLFESTVVAAQSGIFTAKTNDLAFYTEPVEDYSVVIPFFGNQAFTGHCVDSVLINSVNRPHVILVDDGTRNSQGEQFLGGLRPDVSILKLGSNHGYTAAVNAGVLASRTAKVIILNNDTKVLPGWDTPLLLALDDEKVFAAGPLSNAASYQSVPEQRGETGWAVNDFSAAVHPRTLSRALRDEFRERSIDWPILNGFCYAVRVSTFIDLGMLDQSAFPRGYGEEVDLMLRSQDAGYRNVIVPSSFVYHYKSKTFAGQRSALTAQSNLVLQERWGERLTAAVIGMDASEELTLLRNEVNACIARISTELSC